MNHLLNVGDLLFFVLFLGLFCPSVIFAVSDLFRSAGVPFDPYDAYIENENITDMDPED